MAALTWRNVDTPNDRAVWGALSDARSGVTEGLDKFNSILQARQAVNQGVTDRARAAAQQSILDRWQTIQSPEEAAALQASGVMDQQVAGLDARDRTLVRGAGEARIAALRNQKTIGNAFEVSQAGAPAALLQAQNTAANTPTQIALSNAELAAKVATQPDRLRLADLTGKTAVTTAQTASKAADFAATQLPTVQANQLAETRLAASRLPIQQREVDNAAQDQIINTEIATNSQKYLEQKLAGRLKLTPLAKPLGIPLDTTGAPDIRNASPEQRKKLDAAATAAGLQTTSDLYLGDGKAVSSFLSYLRSKPGITPEAIARNMSKIAGAHDSVRIGAPVGDDALAIALQRAETEVRIKEQDSRNRYAPGNPDAVNAYEQIAKNIAADPSFKDSPEDLPHVQEVLQRVSTKGIKNKQGDYIIPSEQDVMAAVRSTYEGWNIRNRGRSEDIWKALKASVSDTNLATLQAQREESLRFKRGQDVRNILNPQTPAILPLNPLGIMPNQPLPKR